MEHIDIPAGDIHVAHNWVFQDATARAQFSTTDGTLVDRLGLQLSDGSYWRLSSVTPAIAWVPVVSVTSVTDALGFTPASVALANSKAPLDSPTFTGTVAGITSAMVGLGNVDNTADAGKPVSAAQQAALNLKAPLVSPAFSGTVTGITSAMVGLGNVDNTSDADKPLSIAQQAALAGLWNDRGNYNPVSGTFPGGGGSGAGGQIRKGDVWTFNGGGTISGTVVSPNQTVRALIDNAGNIAADWTISPGGGGAVGVDNSLTLGVINRAPSQNAVLALKDASGGFAGLTLFKVNFKNSANTVTSFLTNTNTAARTYTFQDKSGTMADIADLALKANLATPTFTGTVTIPSLINPILNFNRAGGKTNGIQWYSSSYTAWSEYMSEGNLPAQGPTGTINPVNGTLVNGWSRRSCAQNAAGFGWIWESTSATGTSPGIVAELRASDGAARFGGTVAAPLFTGDLVGNVTGNLTTSGPVACPQITAAVQRFNRSGGATNGIQWYSSSYTAWSEYMSEGNLPAQGPTGTINPVNGTLVNGWSRRSCAQNAAGFGWIWESTTPTGTVPVIVAELHALDGAARFAGVVSAAGFSGPVTATPLKRTMTAPVVTGNVLALNCASGNFFAANLNANITSFSVTNIPSAGNYYKFELELTADGTARTIGWTFQGVPVKWPGGVPPTPTSASGKKDVFSFYTYNAGATWIGAVVGQSY